MAVGKCASGPFGGHALLRGSGHGQDELAQSVSSTITSTCVSERLHEAAALNRMGEQGESFDDLSDGERQGAPNARECPMSIHDLDLPQELADRTWLRDRAGCLAEGSAAALIVAGQIERAFDTDEVAFSPERKRFEQELRYEV